MPSATSFFLWTADVESASLSGFLRALKQHLATDDNAWSSNLLYIADVRGLDVKVLALLLADLRRLQRRRRWRLADRSRELRPHDQRALEDAARWRPGTRASFFLLASVKLRGRELRVLLAAAQSSSEDWALHVLRGGRGVRRRFSAASEPHEDLQLAVDAARAAIQQGMAALLSELLALNQPAVERAADGWQRDVDDGRVRPRGTAKAAESVAAGIASSFRRRKRWESVGLLVLERRRRRRLQGERGSGSRRSKWLCGPRRSQERPPHPVLELPAALFALVVAFV